MSLEALKLSRQLQTAMAEAGHERALPLQMQVLSRLRGGQDVIIIAPEGAGKSTLAVLSIASRLKFPSEEAPRALVMLADKTKVQLLAEQFRQLNRHTGLRVLELHAGGGIEGQRESLAEGTDVVIGTPDRILALYLKSSLNLNRLQQFILDDAELIVKQGFQSVVHQITLSLPKCQHLVFSEVMHDKLERMTSLFMNFPAVIEADIAPEKPLETIPLHLYQVPNYKTKQNLLNLMLSDAGLYTKCIVFVNTRLTATNLYKSLSKRFPGDIALLKPKTYDQQGFQSVAEFKKAREARVLLIANEIEHFTNLNDVPFIFHFDLPAEKDLFISRVDKSVYIDQTIATGITFATDIELIIVKKIEQFTGQKMEVQPHPAGLVIEGTRKKKVAADDSALSEKSPVSNQGAYHEKKASNAKDYNWGWKEKNKLYGKKYKSPKKRGGQH